MAKKSKYAGVVDSLPKLGIDPERRAVVDAVKAAIRTATAISSIEAGTVSSDRADAAENIEHLLYLLKHAVADKPYAAEFARAYAECRSVKEQIDGWLSSVNLLIEAYQWLMVDQMEVEGVTKLTLANGQPVSTWLEPHAKVEDREAFRLWCLADPDLSRKLALPWGVTNSLVKDRLLAGEPEPPGVTCNALTKVRLGSE